MKLLKTNKDLFIGWLSLGFVGYLLNYFVIKPMMYGWTVSYNFSDNLLYNIYRLFVAEILLLPAVVLAISGSVNAFKNKHLFWGAIHTLGLIALIIFVIYFAIPTISPSRGL